jgi:NADP-dependent 3-hydroxy acid dehydrogenase YdfG
VADDPVLLITGASSGIGEATARAAAEAGYRLVLGARRIEALESLAAEIGGPERAVARRCDVTEWEDQEALVGAALESFERLDAVFANAGFGASRGFLQESPEQWRSMVLTNVYGVALTIRAALPTLLDAGEGHFLITGSVAGRRALPGSLYSATKWAAGATAESLRQEIRQMHENHSIRVTLIEPGMVDTPFFDQRPGPARALVPDDIARAALFALSQPPHVDVNEVLIRPTSQPN